MAQQALVMNDAREETEIVPFDLSCISVQDGHVVAYFLDEVLVGGLSGGKITFHKQPDWRRLSELHAFNLEAEYRAAFSKQAGGFLERTLEDAGLSGQMKSGEVFTFEENMLIIGNCTNAASKVQRGGFVQVSEVGREVVLPRSAENRKIRVRSYLRATPFGEDGLNETFSLWDWRFVSFEGSE